MFNYWLEILNYVIIFQIPIKIFDIRHKCSNYWLFTLQVIVSNDAYKRCIELQDINGALLYRVQLIKSRTSRTSTCFIAFWMMNRKTHHFPMMRRRKSVRKNCRTRSYFCLRWDLMLTCEWFYVNSTSLLRKKETISQTF